MLKYELVPEDQSENRNREIPIEDAIKYCFMIVILIIALASLLLLLTMHKI